MTHSHPQSVNSNLSTAQICWHDVIIPRPSLNSSFFPTDSLPAPTIATETAWSLKTENPVGARLPAKTRLKLSPLFHPVKYSRVWRAKIINTPSFQSFTTMKHKEIIYCPRPSDISHNVRHHHLSGLRNSTALTGITSSWTDGCSVFEFHHLVHGEHV